MIRVLLVDDHALVRMGFRMLLATPRLEAVAEADTGEQACAEYPRLKPDVVVMDLSMPGIGGLEAVRRLLAQDPKARVLALSALRRLASGRDRTRPGAPPTRRRRTPPAPLMAPVPSVASGQRYVDAATAQALALAQLEGDANPADTLSEREFSVFIQLARGQSVAQIAQSLNLSPSTVGTHLYHVKQKLGASNQSELTLVALRWGLIQA